MVIVFIILGIVVCIAVGFSISQSLNKKNVDTLVNRLGEENTFLREQIEKFKESIDYWSKQATTNHEAQHKVFQNYNANAANTISTIVGMLQALQSNTNSNLSKDDKAKIESMIEQAKGIV